MMIRTIGLLLVCGFCNLSLHAQQLRLDSITQRWGDHVGDVIRSRSRSAMPIYDQSYYDEEGRISRIIHIREQRNQIREVTVERKGEQAVLTPKKPFNPEIKIDGETVFKYNRQDQLILRYDSIYADEAQTMITYRATYDDMGRLTTEYKPDGKYVREACYFSYDYDEQGTLLCRRQYIHVNSKKWVKGKIVDTCVSLKEVAVDSCDNRGNMILCTNYDSGDTLRYTYDEHNRLTSWSEYRRGECRRWCAFSYDEQDNPVLMRHGRENMDVVDIYTLSYLPDVKIEDVADLDIELVRDLSGLRSMDERYVYFKPVMHNAPRLVVKEYTNKTDTDYHHKMEGFRLTFHYSDRLH